MANLIRMAERPGCERCEETGLTLKLVEAGSRLMPKAIPERTSSLDDLAATIEAAIIPRLLLSLDVRRPMNDLSPLKLAGITADSVREFTALSFSPDSAESASFVEGLLEDGIAFDRILLDLLAPSARLLGDMWSADQISFVDVTLGLTRIQKMLRQARGVSEGRGAAFSDKGKALLVPAPGEQHTFGLRIVEEFLLKDGWDVRSNLRAELDDVRQLVAEEAFDFIGFSLSGERLLPDLGAAIREVRKVSRNKAIRIMVGGVLFVGRPDLVQEVEADAAVLDADQAVSTANAWFTQAVVN